MNNILHLRYAIEVEKTGSITKAAENLYMGQPHLSKAIKELEDSLGIVIFNRTSKGVLPTKKGQEFLEYAKNILAQIDEMEALYHPAKELVGHFDISVPRASYIAYAFMEYVSTIAQEEEIDVNYRETNSMRAIKNVADHLNNIAIIRYKTIHEKYFFSALEERGLDYKPVWEFEYLALMSQHHALAKTEIIDCSELSQYTEIIHGDLTVPALPVAKARKQNIAQENKKKIAVYERASQLELLSHIPTTYMWVSPMPKDALNRFELVQKRCDLNKNSYKDILIFRSGYQLSDADKSFCDKLQQAVDAVKTLD